MNQYRQSFIRFIITYLFQIRVCRIHPLRTTDVLTIFHRKFKSFRFPLCLTHLIPAKFAFLCMYCLEIILYNSVINLMDHLSRLMWGSSCGCSPLQWNRRDVRGNCRRILQDQQQQQQSKLDVAKERWDEKQRKEPKQAREMERSTISNGLDFDRHHSYWQTGCQASNKCWCRWHLAAKTGCLASAVIHNKCK